MGLGLDGGGEALDVAASRGFGGGEALIWLFFSVAFSFAGVVDVFWDFEDDVLCGFMQIPITVDVRGEVNQTGFSRD